jgi:hypothetical protein
MGQHRASPLRHTVHLGLPHKKPLGHRRPCDNRRHGQHPLSADSRKNYIAFHKGIFTFLERKSKQ